MVRKKIDRIIFYVGILIAAFILLLVLFAKVWGIDVFEILGPCKWYTRNNIYCVTCGTSRAIIYMLKGHFLKSIYYQPAVLYVTVIYLVYMVSYSVFLVSKGRVKYLRLYPIHGYVALGMLEVLLVVRNVALIAWNINLI